MSNPASTPLRRGVEQILATADHTTLVVKASKDGKLDILCNAFVEEKATILVGERLEVRNHNGQVRVLRRSAKQ
jgi:hypothetical protein